MTYSVRTHSLMLNTIAFRKEEVEVSLKKHFSDKMEGKVKAEKDKVSVLLKKNETPSKVKKSPKPRGKSILVDKIDKVFKHIEYDF